MLMLNAVKTYLLCYFNYVLTVLNSDLWNFSNEVDANVKVGGGVKIMEHPVKIMLFSLD